MYLFIIGISFLLGWIDWGKEFEGPLPQCEDVVISTYLKRELGPDNYIKLCQRAQSDPYLGSAGITTLVLGLMAATAGGVSLFNNADKVVFWRESSTGTNSFAYFLGKDLPQIPFVVLYPLVFYMIYYWMTVPFAPFVKVYFIYALVWFCGLGISYPVAILLNDKFASFAAVVFILFFYLFAGISPGLKSLTGVAYILPMSSFLRWGVESIYVTNLMAYTRAWDENIILNHLNLSGFGCHIPISGGAITCTQETTSRSVLIGICMLAILGILFRVIACVILHFKDRSKRR